MNETQMAKIDVVFEKLYQDARTAYRNVYDGIQQQLRGSDSRGLSGEIAQLEAKKLNQEILKLTDTVKQEAISEMIACGCKPYLTQAGWTEIQQIAGLPKTEFCKLQVNTMPPSVKADFTGSASVEDTADVAYVDRRKKKLEKMVRQYGDTEKVLALIAGAGVVAVVVSIFVPGWALPVKILCVSGVIVAVLSGVGAVSNAHKKNEAISKFEEIGKSAGKPVAPKTQANVQLESIVKQITDSQYERNLKLYDAWLREVKRALVDECDRLSAM